MSAAPTRRRWTMLALATLSQALFSSVFVVVPVLLPFLQRRYGMSASDIGATLAAVNLGMAVTLVPWGQLADRWSERVVMPLGLTGAAGGYLGAAVAPTFAWLLVALVLAGASGVAVNAGSTRAVAALFGPAERATALGIRQTAIPLGGALFAVLLPPVATRGGSTTGFELLAGVMLVAAAAAAAVRVPRATVVETSAVDPHPLRDFRVWRIATAGGLMLCGQACILGYVVLFMHNHRGMSLAAAGAVLAISQCGGALLLLLAGRASDRSARRLRPLRRLGGLSAASLLLVTAAVDGPLPLLLAASIAACALSLSWVGLCSAATGESVHPSSSGAALGLQQAMMAAAATLSPVGFGLLLSGGWQAAFLFASAGPLLGAWMLHRMRDPAPGAHTTATAGPKVRMR